MFCNTLHLSRLQLQAFASHCPAPSARVLVCVQWLTLASAALDPVVYTVFNADFRLAVKQTLLCSVCHKDLICNVFTTCRRD